jgi:NADPH-dependent ferric siderophore reductase
MQPLPATDEIQWPSYRPFRVAVRALTPLGPRFVRVTLSGPDLDLFDPDGPDRRVKVAFPLPSGHLTDLGAAQARTRAVGDWYDRWQRCPVDQRSPIRTYTARAVRPATRELDLDFVVHDGAVGPAGSWLRSAEVGDELVVVGPDRRSDQRGIGFDWRPGVAVELLLAGDETAAPAMARIVEELPAGVRACVLIEVPTAADALVLNAGMADVRWLVRDPVEPGRRLADELRQWLRANPQLTEPGRSQLLEDVDVDRQLLWEAPSSDGSGRFYAWLAGEAAVIKRLRRIVVGEFGLDRNRVAFMGYWRRGRSETG